MADVHSYPASSLIDLARIPPDAWPRFAAELPAILALLAPMVAALDERGADQVAYDALIARLDWLDDGLTHIDATVTTTDGAPIFKGRIG